MNRVSIPIDISEKPLYTVKSDSIGYIMSKVNQLLAKAMSTSSEEEAIACLRMARKVGGEVKVAETKSEYNGHDAEYWYEKAKGYYERVTVLKAMYELAEKSRIDYRSRTFELEMKKDATDRKIAKLESSRLYWIMLTLSACAFSVLMIGIAASQ